jgi:hypothetical protein
MDDRSQARATSSKQSLQSVSGSDPVARMIGDWILRNAVDTDPGDRFDSSDDAAFHNHSHS